MSPKHIWWNDQRLNLPVLDFKTFHLLTYINIIDKIKCSTVKN